MLTFTKLVLFLVLMQLNEATSASAVPQGRLSSLRIFEAGLWNHSSKVRNTAMLELQSGGSEVISLFDPFVSGCFDRSASTKRCENYDLYLSAVVSILGVLSEKEWQVPTNTEHPASDLLWKMVYSVEPYLFDFSFLKYRDRTDGETLRRDAIALLDRVLDVSSEISEREAGLLAVARTESEGLRWYVLRRCAGVSMLAGCTYGSYLFTDYQPGFSFRLMRYGKKENVGAGVAISLRLIRDGFARFGALQATGGFGGDIERVVVYNLFPESKPMCEISGEEGRYDLFTTLETYVKVSRSGCKALIIPEGVNFLKFREP